MSDFNQFDISDFFNEVKEPLFLMDSEEIIFWNDYAKENYSDLSEDWKTWFSNPELIEMLNEFFANGVVPDVYYFHSLQKKNGEQERYEWGFVNLPSSYSSKFLIVKANKIRNSNGFNSDFSILKSESEANQQLGYMQSIIHHSHDLIAILDEKGNYKFISESVGEKLGFEVDDIIGRNFKEFQEAGIIELVKGDFDDVLKSEDEVPIDFWIHSSRGENVYLESYAKNLLDHPEIQGILFSSRDITDFIETDKSLQKRYEIENLINQISSRFINSRLQNLEDNFQEFLRRFSIFLQAKKSSISVFNRETEGLEVLNTWSLDKGDIFSALELEQIISGRKRRLEAGIVKLLDHEESEFPSKVLLIPMVSVSKLLGVIFFEIEAENFELIEKELQIFRQVGDILASAYIGNLMTRKIERNENLLTTAEHLSKSGSWRYSNAKDIFYVSGGLAKLFGLGDQPVTAEFSSLILKIEKPHREEFVKKLKQSIANQSKVSGEFTIKNKEGKTTYIAYEIESKQDYFSQGLEVNGFCTDISHKRAAEEYLRLQSQILTQVNDPIIVANLEYEVIYLNASALRFCDAEKGSCLSKNVETLIDWNLPRRAKFQTVAEKLKVGEVWKNEVFVHDSDGKKIPFEVSIQGIHADGVDKIGYSIIFRDLTDKYENERLASRARMIVENSPAVLFQVDPNDDYRIYYISENISQFGYESNELMKNKVSFLDLLHPEDADVIREKQTKSRRKNGVVAFSGEFRIVTPDGVVVWVEDKTSDVKNESGDIVLHQGLFQDITDRKNFEAFKEEKEKQYRVLASNIPGTNVFLIDKDRKYIVAEGTNFEYWEMTPEDFEGKYLSDISLTDQQVVSEILDKVYNDLEIVETEFFIKERRYHRVIRPILEFGKVEYALSIIRDITEEHQAKEDLKNSEEKFRTLVESSTEVIFSLSESFILDYLSPNINQFLGYEASEVIGKNIFEFINPDDLEVFQGILEENTDFLAKNQYLEFRLRHKNGEYRVFNTNGQMVLDKDGKTRMYTGIARDISKLKEAQNELVKAKERAEQASLIKSQFLSVMSHEIRTPMNAVIGLAHFLMEDNPRADQLENLKTLQFSAESLMALINDILDYNKIDSGKVELEKMPFDLKNLIRRIVHSHSFQANEKSLELFIEIDETIPKGILGDSVRIGQIVNNLLSNAIKFTEKGFVKIKLSKKSKPQDGITSIQFGFEDTGIGIPDEKLETIFEAFTQASSETTRKYGGTGLGLAIVKRLIELHGGEIKYKANPLGGSIFEFTLEFEVEKEQIDQLQENGKPAPKSLSGASVLVAEDNMVNQILIKKFLKKWETGKVVVASDGQETLECFEKEHFDLILLDLQMPIYDGFTVAKMIREFPDIHKKRVPILALTASSFHEVKESLIESGIDGYVPKPFTPEVLYSKMVKFLGLKEKT
ncbi:PAS domain S-box protein [Algoriphagus zhangzhouensis]|uniref:histidine kinase n=1 Tax=Algoriphagus zhangzhouensis TaxID=1073327 RepID=A0A1M7Z4K2_9BACT|nr:PAS domain S-box protein [Algoriphagus zhangzhouensis]TDY48558.1 PAS domain S-box-containing protein [Algoriphagus zhangzhouensis]SHO59606.1 PAS domain S-box-containing protein [Algoriphagus zhangzhouensis]